MTSLIRFYDPQAQGKDAQGRTLSQILNWNDEKLEYHHDYIQILFPLPEGSPFNPSAPIVDRITFDAFRSRSDLRGQLRSSLARLLWFYGFDLVRNFQGGVITDRITPASHFPQASKNWVKRFNHNHLRITRIIRSLRVLGLEHEAQEFFKALCHVYDETGRISERSLMFWTRAAERPLYLAPEDEDNDAEKKHKGFLFEFEERKSSTMDRGSHGASAVTSNDVVAEQSESSKAGIKGIAPGRHSRISSVSSKK